MKTITPVILCGGAGSRLWPASRESYPKQLVSLVGERSLLQETVLRITETDFAAPIVITGHDYRFLVAEQLRAIGVHARIVIEPARRDSCAAAAAAAALAAGEEAGQVLLVLAADHAIPDRAAFQAHVARAATAARAGHIVTFGIRPAHPAIGYGYIRLGEALAGLPGTHRVSAFFEKPDAATAERFVADGYLWNSGNFMMQADVFLEELQRFEGDLHAAVTEAVAAGREDLDFFRLDRDCFMRSPSISLDYAVMEKTARGAVVPADFAWSDIGSWSAVWELAAKDQEGNAASGDVVLRGSRNTFVHSPETLTAVVGLDDAVVVATRDAVLVAARSHAEEVKALVQDLAASGRVEAREHLKTWRPWGSYQRIDLGPRYQVKRITVKPKARLSLQSHHHRSEHWVVVCGTALVTIVGKITAVHENQSIYVPAGAVHRIENPGRIPLELIEVQTGSYLGEDDIVRYEDDYSRP